MPQEEILNRLHSITENYLKENLDPDTPVVEYREPKVLENLVDLPISEDGVSESKMMDLVEDYLQYSVRTGHPQFLNQLYQGFNLPGFVGEVVTALSNTSMYTYEVAPVATLIEQEVISKMCAAIGYESNEGIFLPGASNANMTALLAARNRKLPSTKYEGVSGQMVLFVSDQAHYSFEKAANTIGIGIDNVIKVA